MANLRCVAALSAVVAVAAVGCGGSGGSKLKTVPVSGKVTLDGTPLEGAMVSFVQDQVAGKQSHPAFGKTDAQGVYKLEASETPSKSVPGAVPGKYAVIITKQSVDTSMEQRMAKMTPEQIDQLSDEEKQKMGMQGQGAERNTPTGPSAGAQELLGKSLLPEKYGNPKDSGLEADVKESGAQTFDFELKSQG